MFLVAEAQEIHSSSVQKNLTKLEIFSGGRIGLDALNTANNHHIQFHAEDLFPIQSTFR